mmetsp:Transcript_23247/g.32449  ORF Transcript_23247/g.32449 Transcript_23247/m.32449 type:complete len:103 (-) Transcript_23247:10-318(-)|eukprot:CAMPEP_0184489734 /NCGR_PEP_ID=MMETSP0113_2-20130426/16246_1 /TAXON_ID=91329 /ORGANISM="Norrisiella sphaerica, Strain BC52" /LENGTH=102 /DNA_ID=CAMNT_0026873325 /DNA_START=76 /DNA_END=384 /DNA_ORIENTATION=-
MAKSPEDSDYDYIRARQAQRRLQNFIFMEQQKETLTHAVIRLADKCFRQCANPGTRRTRALDDCMTNCANRYVESSVLVLKTIGSKVNKIDMDLKHLAKPPK